MNAGLAVAKGAAGYCCDLVRTYDRDRYRLALSQKPRHRAALLALFAFNHEIAKTREVVSDPTLGLIRLQWWREAIENMLIGKVMEHEVLQSLSKIYRPFERSYDLLAAVKADFFALLDAREFDLEGCAMLSAEELADYAEKTTAPLNRLSLRVVNTEDAGLTEISTAYALTGLMRAQPFLADRPFLPHGVMASAIAQRADTLLDKAGRTQGFLAASAVLTRLYLRRMARAGYDLTDVRINMPPTGFSLAALAGRFR